MAENPARFVRVSTPSGLYTVPAAVAGRADDWTVLEHDAVDKGGKPLPAKPRTEIADTPPAAKRRTSRKRASRELREHKPAATPTTPEAPASGDTPEE